MEKHEIEKRNAILKELMLAASERSFWDRTLKLTTQSLSEAADAHWGDIETALIVGHGTSLATATNAQVYLSHIAGLQAIAMPAFELCSYPDDYIKKPKHTLVIGISCSGNTASVVKSLETARAMGCLTLCLSGEGSIKGAQAAELRILTDCHIESRGDTSHPYSVSHLFLLLGAYKLSILIGRASGRLSAADEAYWLDQMEKALKSLSCLPSLYETMGDIAAQVRDIGALNQVVLGSGPNHGTMVEGALKICEFSWQLGAGEELEDFAHGRFREMDEKTPLFILSPQGPCIAKTMDLLAGAAIANTNTVIFTDSPTPAMEKLAKRIVLMPALENEYLTPFLYVFPLWFFGYRLNADCGKLVGGARYGLLATDINFQVHFDQNGNRL